MRKLLLLGLGLCAAAAIVRSEEREQPVLPAFLAALALEAGIFLLRRHQSVLLGAASSSS